jgi:S-adenosylmethionine hydrolase
MAEPLITLTTDFGDSAPYVSVMKGVIYALCPVARVVDLTHAIAPQNIRQAAYFLATAVPYFPAGTIHVCVVDPGVGTERAALYTQVDGQHLVGPDNGLFTLLWRHARERPSLVRRLTEARFWRPVVSATFHGRDIFAPVAAHLARGVPPEELGPLHPHPVQLAVKLAVCTSTACEGEIQAVDDFGNLITNIPAAQVPQLPSLVTIGSRPPLRLPWVRTYGDAPPGTLVSLFSSDGYFEIAQVQGSAARQLQVGAGESVRLTWEAPVREG